MHLICAKLLCWVCFAYLQVLHLTFVSSQGCDLSQFRCFDGYLCISKKWVCDGYLDCYDESDEKDCWTAPNESPASTSTLQRMTSTAAAITPAVSCSTEQYGCSNRMQCIPLVSRCNGISDCTDNSDETNCPSTQEPILSSPSMSSTSITSTTVTTATTLSTTMAITTSILEKTFTTSSYINLSTQLITNTSTSNLLTTPTFGTTAIVMESILCSLKNVFRCLNSECIPGSYKCDGTKDCGDGSDENNCTYPCNRDNEVLCPNSQCKNSSLYCGGQMSCSTYSNDLYCSNTTKVDYKPNNGTVLLPKRACLSDLEFTCTNKNCIPKRWTCDGVDDCHDYSDEKNCTAGLCPKNYFTCKSSRNCIGLWQVCNRIEDCRDGSDEINCSFVYRPASIVQLETVHIYWQLTQSCTVQEFTCTNIYDWRCMPLSWRCDEVDDCQDKSDESCNSSVSKTCDNTAMEREVFQCWNGNGCINPALKCNFAKDCSDGSDELGCYCEDEQRTIRCGNYECISVTKWCDGFRDCQDNSDETFCEIKQCLTGSFRCEPLSRCLPSKYRCDRLVDCPDQSDEKNCPCSANRGFTCGNGTCVEFGKFCDGVVDCPDGADELSNCGTNCAPNLFQCHSTFKCIHRTSVCDSIPDCPDASDEQNCPRAAN